MFGKMSLTTVAITDYELRSPTLAKVILSFTGTVDKQTIRAALAEKLAYLATPVENSFKIIKAGVAVGFVRANKEVRAIDENELKAYRIVSSNIMMDDRDKTLWAVQEGKGGKYLTRQGEEDLSELVEAATYHRSDVPGLRHLAIAKAAKSELVAYVAVDGSMDYGFAVANNESKVKVLSYQNKAVRTVDYADVVSIYPIQVDREIKQQVAASLSSKDKADQISYYTQLYSFAPDYLNEIIKQIEADTVA